MRGKFMLTQTLKRFASDQSGATARVEFQVGE